MVISTGYRLQTCYIYKIRYIEISFTIYPKCTILPISPCPNRSIGFLGNYMFGAAGNELPVCGVPDFCGKYLTNIGTITQLSGIIITPGPNCTIGFYAYSKIFPNRNLRPVCGCTDLNKYISVNCCSITNLTKIIPATAPKGSIFFYCKRIEWAGVNFLPVCCNICLSWNHKSGICPAISKLTILIAAPGPECSI